MLSTFFEAPSLFCLSESSLKGKTDLNNWAWEDFFLVDMKSPLADFVPAFPQLCDTGDKIIFVDDATFGVEINRFSGETITLRLLAYGISI